MPVFDFSALDKNGARVAGTVEAATAADAAEQLVRRGLVPIATGPSNTDLAPGSAPSSLRDRELLTFCRQLSTLLAASLPLDQALQLVAAQNARAPVGLLATRVGDSVISGRPLSEALSRHASGLPGFVTALIAAGEARGRLAPALDDLTRILERRGETRARVRSAILYPAVLIGVALLVVAIVLGILVPTLLPLFEDARRPAPAVLRAADQFMRFVVDLWPFLIALVLLIGIGISKIWRRDRVRAAVDAMLLKVPVFGLLARDSNVSVTARTLGTLLSNGIALPDALTITSGVATNRTFRSTLTLMANEVREGVPLASAISRHPVYPEQVQRFIAIGETASRLDAMLLHLADASERDASRRLDAALNLLSPALTILIGLVIGGLILSVMQATLSINDLAVR